MPDLPHDRPVEARGGPVSDLSRTASRGGGTRNVASARRPRVNGEPVESIGLVGGRTHAGFASRQPSDSADANRAGNLFEPAAVRCSHSARSASRTRRPASAIVESISCPAIRTCPAGARCRQSASCRAWNTRYRSASATFSRNPKPGQLVSGLRHPRERRTQPSISMSSIRA